jgi:sugar phosphate isomerase/epimerase
MRRKLSVIKPIKARYPFRLGTTSYILPADLIPNVRFLAPLIDDVELVLFESEEISNLPDPDVIAGLKELKIENRISYTVHLPLDISLGSCDETCRILSVDKCLRIIDVTRPLAPFAYIVHFHGERRGPKPAQNMDCWKKALDLSVRDLLASGVRPELLSVETLDYPFECVYDIVSSHGLSVCLDIGHLAFHGFQINEYIDRYLDQTRVVHLHGFSNGTDHKDIAALPEGVVPMVISTLCSDAGKERILTLEVFGLTDFKKSIEVIRKGTE